MDEYIKRSEAIESFDNPDVERNYGDVEPESVIRVIEQIPAADVVPASVFRDCRNELCLKCGAYTQKHLGACDGCRWRKTDG